MRSIQAKIVKFIQKRFVIVEILVSMIVLIFCDIET